MKVDSLKHKKATRVRIPSKQEAGSEPAPEQEVIEFPLNRVIHRGRDPELHWMDKYGADNRQTHLQVDIRSLYRHEHIAPEVLIKRLYSLKEDGAQHDLFINELFGNALQIDELEKPGSYYRHTDGWTNRLIQGDSLLVMTSLLEREGMAGKVQMIYIDPPYGIKYGSNWQMRLNDRNVKDGDDASLTGEPEVIKAFRDTWELGIHSYLSYLRERLLVARDLLTESGSCFVQISDENVHLVRCVMDEVFGAENFCRVITFQKTSGQKSRILASTVDFIIWYCKNFEQVKFNQLYQSRQIGDKSLDRYDMLLLPDGMTRRLTKEEISTFAVDI